MAKKAVLLELLAETVRREQEFIDGLSDAQRAAIGEADNWSAKDLVAHCAYWKKRRVAEIPKVLAGGTPEVIDDFDHENELIFKAHRDMSWDEIIALSHDASHEIVAQVQQMSEQDLERPWQDDRLIWRTIVGNGYSHTMVHLAEHYQNEGDMAKAAELTALLGQPLAELDDSPSWQGTVKYNAACGLSLLGKKEAAIKELGEAFKMTPALIEWSKQDPDLEPLREEEAFQALYQ
ncbi:MAG: ClbS/DfsB family four-helix bundle protein [Candidatus Promineifilaceae bacterium]|nr:ClbS/DfsB family four-helix bundle protein [Candidatus Promineifilaceae bacterium]